MYQSHMVWPVSVTVVFGHPHSRTGEAIETLAEKPQDTNAILHVTCGAFATERRIEACTHKPQVRFEVSVSCNRRDN